jgi:hypothetical protein
VGTTPVGRLTIPKITFLEEYRTCIQTLLEISEVVVPSVAGCVPIKVGVSENVSAISESPKRAIM